MVSRLKRARSVVEIDEMSQTSDRLPELDLITLAEAGDEAAVRAALDAGACVSQTNDGGSTALHHACYVQHVEIVALLLERGADPHLRDSSFGSDAVGWLDQSVFDGNGTGTAIAESLIARGVDVDASRCVVFDLPDRLAALLAAEPTLVAERPLLHDAIYLDRPACIDVLLRAGASADATFPELDDADYHTTPRAFAERLGRPLPPTNTCVPG